MPHVSNLDLKSTTEADAFWRITPAGTNLPDPMEKKDGRFVLPEAETEESARRDGKPARVPA